MSSIKLVLAFTATVLAGEAQVMVPQVLEDCFVDAGMHHRLHCARLHLFLESFSPFVFCRIDVE